MRDKYFILNADNFGISKDFNRAILYAYEKGLLKSAALCAVGEAFDNAVNEILPECQSLSLGVQLNLTNGQSLTRCHLLTDNNGVFNKGYFYLLINSKNKELLKQIEKEFRTQIEKIIQFSKPDFIASLKYIHEIPEIFKLTLKLAKEYNIPFVRTHLETFYFVPKLSKNLNFKYFKNLLKFAFSNHFAKANKQLLKSTELKTNDYILGIEYSKMMDEQTIELGLEAIPDKPNITEVIIHPCKYNSNKNNSNVKEFMITQNKKLENKIHGLGFEITNYKQL